jgi:hypothetical protein
VFAVRLSQDVAHPIVGAKPHKAAVKEGIPVHMYRIAAFRRQEAWPRSAVRLAIRPMTGCSWVPGIGSQDADVILKPASKTASRKRLGPAIPVFRLSRHVPRHPRREEILLPKHSGLLRSGHVEGKPRI